MKSDGDCGFKEYATDILNIRGIYVTMFSGRKNVFGGKHGKWAIMAKKEQTVASIDEIFNLIRAGERQTGIELLYSLHYNKLYGIAFLFVKNQPDTEDIVHNAIYK